MSKVILEEHIKGRIIESWVEKEYNLFDKDYSWGFWEGIEVTLAELVSSALVHATVVDEEGKAHEPDIKDALASAVSAIYFSDNCDYLPALWDIVRALGGQEAVDLIEEDDYRAFNKYVEIVEEERGDE